MFEQSEQPFDFDELANHLVEQGQQVSPSQIHGCLCGLLAAGAAPEAELSLAALSQGMELDLHGELAEQVMSLYSVSAAALGDESFDFHPLLPDDEVDIAQRTESLALWCKGFLTGFALVAAGDDEGASRQVPADSSEVLRDLAAIAEAGVDEDAPEDESEDSYHELVEFIRVAVLNVYMDHLREDGDA